MATFGAAGQSAKGSARFRLLLFASIGLFAVGPVSSLARERLYLPHELEEFIGLNSEIRRRFVAKQVLSYVIHG